MARIELRNSRSGWEIADQLTDTSTTRNATETRQMAKNAWLYSGLRKIDRHEAESHQEDPDDKALIRHPGAEGETRHGQKSEREHHRHDHAGRVDADQLPVNAEPQGRGEHQQQRNIRQVRIDRHHHGQRIELSLRLPTEIVRQAPGRARDEEIQERQERYPDRPALAARNWRAIASCPTGATPRNSQWKGRTIRAPTGGRCREQHKTPG